MRTTISGPHVKAAASQIIMSTCKTHGSAWGECRVDPRNPSGELVLIRPSATPGPAALGGALCVILPIVTITAAHGMRLGLGNVKYVQSSRTSKTSIEEAHDPGAGGNGVRSARLYLTLSEEGRFVGSDTYSIVDQTGCGRGVGTLIVNYDFEVIRSRSYGDGFLQLAAYGDAARAYALRALVSIWRHPPDAPSARIPAIRVPGTSGVYLTGSARALVVKGTWVGGQTQLCALPPATIPVGTTVAIGSGAKITSTSTACSMTGSSAAITDFPGLRVYRTTPPPHFRLYSNTSVFCLPNGTDVPRGATADIYSVLTISALPYPRVGSVGSLVGTIGDPGRVIFGSVEDGEAAPGGFIVVRRPCVVRILQATTSYRVTFSALPVPPTSPPTA
jgi:hypothetical protein